MKAYEFEAINVLNRYGYLDYYPEGSKFTAWRRDYYHVRLKLGYEFSDNFLTFYLYDQKTNEVCMLIKSVALNDQHLFDHINLAYGTVVVLFNYLYTDDENPLREGDLKRIQAKVESVLETKRQGGK